ncbi:uncharacterized protein LOC110820254 [Carica papaya]|uniref:uncharacterized protein LOC110820254 n=1 Tax=Carica papaya TaxID=3649 RepID=UPI000B8CB123|nr:uncharacterized protein LOC110820254 [Carica papaya]
MTVNTTKQTQDRVSHPDLEQKATELLTPPEHTAGEFTEKIVGKVSEEMETESGRSSDEESPKSVGKWRKECVHSQVLRIIEEDSHLGEDKVANCGVAVYCNHHDKHCYHQRYHRVDLVLLARPMLPCSPLSGKTDSTTVKALQ